MNKVLFRILLMFLAVSCNQSNKKNNGYMLSEEPEFGDNLIIDREDTSFYRYVGSNNEKKILQKGVVLKYHSLDGKVDRVYSWGGGEVVGSCIVKYGIDETFFLVEQKSLDDIFGELNSVGDMLIRDKKPSKIIEMRRMLNVCNCSKYWIINKKTDDIYGPFNLDEFIEKRKELGVSNKIILKGNLNI